MSNSFQRLGLAHFNLKHWRRSRDKREFREGELTLVMIYRLKLTIPVQVHNFVHFIWNKYIHFTYNWEHICANCRNITGALKHTWLTPWKCQFTSVLHSFNRSYTISRSNNLSPVLVSPAEEALLSAVVIQVKIVAKRSFFWKKWMNSPSWRAGCCPSWPVYLTNWHSSIVRLLLLLP